MQIFIFAILSAIVSMCAFVICWIAVHLVLVKILLIQLIFIQMMISIRLYRTKIDKMSFFLVVIGWRYILLYTTEIWNIRAWIIRLLYPSISISHHLKLNIWRTISSVVIVRSVSWILNLTLFVFILVHFWHMS